MQIKSFSPPGPEDLLQEQLISAGGITLNDGKLDSLFEKLSIVDKKDVGAADLTIDLDGEKATDNCNENCGMIQLNPKGPCKKKDFTIRDLPYEQRTFNKNLLNGGGVVEKDRHCGQELLHEMIPIPVQKFQSQTVPISIIAAGESYYQPYAQFVGPSGLGLENANIPIVPQADWLEPSRPPPPQTSPTPTRVDSPLSSDSGINSPSSSPNRGGLQTVHVEQSNQTGAKYPTTVPASDPQGVDYPCSPESGYSTPGSLESHLWPYELSPEQGFYETTGGPIEDERKVNNTSNEWSTDSFAYSSPVGVMNIQYDWYQRCSYPLEPPALTQLDPVAVPYVCSADDHTAYNSNIPLDSGGQCTGNVVEPGKIGSEQWIDPVVLEEFVRELSNLDCPEDARPEPAATMCAPSPQPPLNVQAHEPKPKTKNIRPKDKPPRPERTSQQKRKPSNKAPPLDRAKPKICYMIDHKKEGTKAVWMGISLMSEEKFTKKNKNGQTCLMEVLLGGKLSLERAYFVVQRMKKNGELLSCKDKYGKNALYVAAIQHPHIPELASLVAESYTTAALDVNEGFFEDSNSLIHCLVETGESHVAVLCELLDLKVEGRRIFNPNSTNTKGDTPIHLALRNLSKTGHPFDLSLVDVLLKRGASISIQNSDGETPLHVAAKIACDEKVFRKLFERLLLPPEEKQDAMNIQDNDGNTPLHLIAYHVNPCNVEKMKKVINVFLSEKHTRTDIKNKAAFAAIDSIHQGCVKEFHDVFHRRK